MFDFDFLFRLEGYFWGVCHGSVRLLLVAKLRISFSLCNAAA
jgi:hypothetical protein